MQIFRSPLLAMLATILGTSFAWAKDLPEIDENGMHLVESTKYTTVYADPDANLGIYTEVWLEDATVAFRKHWQRDQNRTYPGKVKQRDIDRIKEELATSFRKVFEEELIKGGYTVATAPGADVLRIKPEIVDLDVIAPSMNSHVGRTNQFSRSAGEMTLKAQLYDSVTDDLIVKTSDRKRDYEQSYMQWRTSVSNRATAERMIRQWATSLVQALDEAHGTVTG